jgi:hypothetical protein
MDVVGRIHPATLTKFKGRGLSPEQAVEAILAEARRRTGCDCIIRKVSFGFEIVALP